MHGNFKEKQANFQISGFKILYSSVVLQFIILGVRLHKTLVLFQMTFLLHDFLVSTKQLIWKKWNFFIILQHYYLLKESKIRLYHGDDKISNPQKNIVFIFSNQF